jgi:hypothetical protein
VRSNNVPCSRTTGTPTLRLTVEGATRRNARTGRLRSLPRVPEQLGHPSVETADKPVGLRWPGCSLVLSCCNVVPEAAERPTLTDDAAPTFQNGYVRSACFGNPNQSSGGGPIAL